MFPALAKSLFFGNLCLIPNNRGNTLLLSGIEYPATSSRGNVMKAPFLIGRMIFGGFFLYNGINHLIKAKEMGPYAESKGVPNGELAVAASGIPLIAGGASLLLGVKPRYGAIAILGFLAGISPIMHDFWNQEDPGQRQTEMINFVKNLALAGGTLALMGVEEPWEASVPAGQHRLSKKIRKIGRTLAA
jgi:putative oxidoreductase